MNLTHGEGQRRAITASGGERVVSPTLVGRAAELARVAHAVAAPPAVVVIDGEAGIGKTRLVSELADRPEVTGRRLLVGRCPRVRESFPLGPVIEGLRELAEQLDGAALSPVAGALRPLLPELAGALPAAPEPLGDGVAERHQVFRALVAVLASLGPAVLVLEDLHWADEQTADFLGYLLSEAPPELAVVLTFRGGEVDPRVRAATARLPAPVRRTDVSLGPLTPAETGDLAAAILGAEQVSEEFATYLCERTSGVPLAIEGLLALLRARGSLVRRGGGWARRALDELDVPASIRESVLERVSGLTPVARSVAEAASVLQAPAPLPVLLATCRAPDAQLGVEEALETTLLAEEGAEVGFRHPLAAQAVYEEIPGPRRRELHHRAAAALAATRPVRLGAVAHHLRRAGRPAEWVDAAERAADQALALGNDDEAVRLLEQVLREAPLDPERRGRLAVRLGEAAIEALRAREVVGMLSEALELELPPEVRGELGFQVGRLLHELGDDPLRVRRLLTGAIEQLGHRPDLQAWAMVILGIPTTDAIDVAEHQRWLRRSLDLLPALDDPVFEVFLLGKVAMLLMPFGDPAWRGLVDRIEHRTGGAPRHRREVNAYWSVGEEACCAGHHEVAARMLAAGLEGAHAGDNRRLELSLRSVSVLLDYCRGEWIGLEAEAATLVDALAAHPRARLDAENAAACLALARGDLDAAHARLTAAVDRCFELGGYDVIAVPVAGRLRLAVARGELEDAAATADRWVALVASKGIWAPDARALPAVTEALAACGRAAETRALVARWGSDLRNLDAPLGPPALAYARGVLATSPEEAAHELTAAAAQYEALRCPYEAALACERAATRLLRAGGPAGYAPLRTAVTVYRRLGAAWDAARAARLARRHGVRVPARHGGGRRGYGSALSPREREVAELAALGRSNKEIAADLYLSVHTVARHVTAAMRKLGVRSRAGIVHRLAGDSEQA